MQLKESEPFLGKRYSSSAEGSFDHVTRFEEALRGIKLKTRQTELMDLYFSLLPTFVKHLKRGWIQLCEGERTQTKVT